MATHSSTLAWKIPWMEEPRRLHSVGYFKGMFLNLREHILTKKKSVCTCVSVWVFERVGKQAETW